MVRDSSRIILLPVAALVVFLLWQGAAMAEAATNPYYGQHIEGYKSTATGKAFDSVSQFYGYTDFAGTTPSALNSHLLSVVSTAGWYRSGETATGIMYQQAVQGLYVSGQGVAKAYHDPQVWKSNGASTYVIYQCYDTPSGCGVISNNINQLSYAYYTSYWNSVRSQVTFYAEGHDSAGNIMYNYTTYTRNTNPASSSYDNSDAFSVGYIGRTQVYSGINYDFFAKLFQVGVESDDPLTNWRIHQYGITYSTDTGAGVRSFSSDNTFSNIGGCSDTLYYPKGVCSDLTWAGTDGVPVRIGKSAYNVDGDYKNKSGSSKPAGDVSWFPGTQLAYGTALWGKGAIHAVGVQLNAASKAVPGMYVTVRDSSNTVIGSGFTPFSIVLPSFQSYKVDYTNYGNYYFTKASATTLSLNPSWYVYNWGAPVTVVPSPDKSHTLDASYHNQADPGNYAKITFDSAYTNNGFLSGMYAGLSDTGILQTRGYTPFTVGMKIPSSSNTMDVYWGNYGNQYYQYADLNVPSEEYSDTKYSWGGFQQLKPTSAGGSYTDVGKYLLCSPFPC